MSEGEGGRDEGERERDARRGRQEGNAQGKRGEGERRMDGVRAWEERGRGMSRRGGGG